MRLGRTYCIKFECSQITIETLHKNNMVSLPPLYGSLPSPLIIQQVIMIMQVLWITNSVYHDSSSLIFKWNKQTNRQQIWLMVREWLSAAILWTVQTKLLDFNFHDQLWESSQNREDNKQQAIINIDDSFVFLTEHSLLSCEASMYKKYEKSKQILMLG